MKATKRLKIATRCWLRGGHDRVGLVTGGTAIVICVRCLSGVDAPIARPPKGPKAPMRSAYDVLGDIAEGVQPETVAVDGHELLALATQLLRLAGPRGEERQLLDMLALAGLDPDRQKPT